MIRKIEELSMNAFPSLDSHYYDGWVLRFSDGKSKRVNSVYSLYPSSLDLMEKVEYCEAVYKSLKMRRVFKLNDDPQCVELDSLLRTRGYGEAGRTYIQTFDLQDFSFHSSEQVEIFTDFSRSWYLDLCEAESRREIDKKVMAEAWKKVIPPQCYISILKDGKRVAFGRGVLDQSYVGIYGIFVDPLWRGKGLGETITRELMNYAGKEGCRWAYLQVEADNQKALNLYEKIGFEQQYTYWYLLHEGS